MNSKFSWLKEIKEIKASNRSVKNLHELLQFELIKGFEIDLLSKSLENLKDYEKLDNLKIAILSDNATQPLSSALKIACFCENYSVSIYECPIGTIKQEVLNSRSFLYKFNPDI